MYQLVPANRHANSYVSRLLQSYEGLATRLLSQLFGREPLALVPAYASDAQIRCYSKRLRGDKADAIRSLGDLAKHWYGRKGVITIQDLWQRPADDQFQVPQKAIHETSGSAHYFSCPLDQLDEETLLGLFEAVASPRVVGVVTTISQRAPLGRGALDETYFFTAYGSEGFLIFRPA